MNTNSFNNGINAYSAPVIKVILIKAQSIICTSPTDDQADGPASNEDYTEEKFVW